MSILANAIASIELGVEDYNLSTSDPNRALSAARNLYAGVLLLLKHRLALVSESLVYQKLKPVVTGQDVTWVADGKKTIDFLEIRDRWKQLGWSFNFALLEKVQKERNNIEHWYAQTSPQTLRELLSDTFQLIVSALRDHLGATPAAVLSQIAWDTMATETKIHEALVDACAKSRQALTEIPPPLEELWAESVQCVSCGSELVRVTEGVTFPDVRLVCDRCGEEQDVDAVVEDCVGREHPEPNRAWRDGGESVGTCPTCDRKTFVIAEDVCFFCGESRPYTECACCGSDMPLDEQDDEYCSYCRHVADKDD